MKLFGFILHFICIGSCVCGCHGQSALSKYIYASNWTPVTEHATDITPGLIIAVNLKDGSWEPVDLQDDENGIPLETFTANLDPAQSAAYADKAAAQKDLRSLFGAELQVELPSDGTIEFSGMRLTVSRLENKRQKQVFSNHSSPTYSTIREWYNGKRVALLLVTQVGSVASIQVRSGTLVGDTIARATPCSDNVLTKNGESTNSLSTNGPTNVAAFRSAERSGVSSDNSRVNVCRASAAQRITLSSAQPIPVAMKVKLITSYSNGTVDTAYGEPPLAFYDATVLKNQCRKLLAAAY